MEGAFADGASDELASFIAKISPATLYNYQKKNPEFLERKEHLKKQVKYQARKNVRKAIKSGDLQQSNWYLERKDKSFKNKTDITSDDEKLESVLVKFVDNENN